MPEVEGNGSRDASLWALLFVDDNGLRAGREEKIVFRMTGRGALSIPSTTAPTTPLFDQCDASENAASRS